MSYNKDILNESRIQELTTEINSLKKRIDEMNSRFALLIEIVRTYVPPEVMQEILEEIYKDVIKG